MLQAQEGERARLARDLHDEANQALTGVLLRLEATAAARAARPARRAARDAGRRHAGDGASSLRLARELRPVALDDLGLGAALRTQVDEFGRRAGLAGRRCSCPPAAVEDLDADEQIVVYRVVQEGLSNVARHAGAAQRARRASSARRAATVVRIADDGAGFEPGVARPTASA